MSGGQAGFGDGVTRMLRDRDETALTEPGETVPGIEAEGDRKASRFPGSVSAPQSEKTEET